MAKYGRVYSDTVEKAQRLEVFKANVGFIESFNAKNHKFYLGINQFTVLTNEEFKATKANKGYKPSMGRMPTGFRYENVSFDALPATVDWRTKGAVTPIKDQGQCGEHIKDNDVLDICLLFFRMLSYSIYQYMTMCRLLLSVFCYRCYRGHR